MIRFFVLFFFILTTISFAEIKKVNIVGNSRVNSNTIETLVDKKITNVDSIFINNLTKKIYDTEFFSDVKISYNQDTLTITVVENPIVNFFYINGVKDSDLDQINKIITLKENSIFSTSKLKKNIEDTREFLNASGYYQATIVPEVIKINNNQVNLIINIDKKDISKIDTSSFCHTPDKTIGMYRLNYRRIYIPCFCVCRCTTHRNGNVNSFLCVNVVGVVQKQFHNFFALNVHKTMKFNSVKINGII